MCNNKKVSLSIILAFYIKRFLPGYCHYLNFSLQFMLVEKDLTGEQTVNLFTTDNPLTECMNHKKLGSFGVQNEIGGTREELVTCLCIY